MNLYEYFGNRVRKIIMRSVCIIFERNFEKNILRFFKMLKFFVKDEDSNKVIRNIEIYYSDNLFIK